MLLILSAILSMSDMLVEAQQVVASGICSDNNSARLGPGEIKQFDIPPVTTNTFFKIITNITNIIVEIDITVMMTTTSLWKKQGPALRQRFAQSPLIGERVKALNFRHRDPDHHCDDDDDDDDDDDCKADDDDNDDSWRDDTVSSR